MEFRNQLSNFGKKANGWFGALLLASLLLCASAQEGEQRPEQVETPQNVEQSIEALFGPDEPQESEEKPAQEESDGPLVYISDTDNGRIVVMQGLAGSGFTALGLPGFGYGRFLRPAQVWVDYDDRLYVADSGNDRVVRMDQRAREAWTEFGGLSSPMGVAVDRSGVYIADTKADRVIKVDEIKEGVAVKEEITHPQMSRPTSLWIDREGALYICSGEDPPGGKLFKTWMDKEHRRWRIFSGEGLSGSRFRPSGVVTTAGHLRLLDESGERVVSMQDMEGTRIKEQRFRSERRSRLSRPVGLAVDETGQRFFIADSGNDRVLEVRADGTVVGEFYGMDDDPTSLLRNPTSIFVHSPAPAPEPEAEEDEKKRKN